MKVKTYGQDWEFEPSRMMEVENGPYVLTFDYNILSTKYEALEAEVVRLKKVRRNHDRLITELKDKLACILEASDED